MPQQFPYRTLARFAYEIARRTPGALTLVPQEVAEEDDFGAPIRMTVDRDPAPWDELLGDEQERYIALVVAQVEAGTVRPETPSLFSVAVGVLTS